MKLKNKKKTKKEMHEDEYSCKVAQKGCNKIGVV